MAAGRAAGWVGCVTGLSAEARILRQVLGASANHRLACAGASALRARACAERLADSGAWGLLSFGVAGGLAPSLRPGTLVLAEAVAIVGSPGARVEALPAWHRAVLAAADPAIALVPGILAGSDAALAGAGDKARLHAETGALAVDMESHAVAAVAAERRLPFLALRAVADPGETTLPRCALAAIGPDGRSRPGRVLLGLASRPWELPALLALDRDFRRALKALGIAAATLRQPLFHRPR